MNRPAPIFIAFTLLARLALAQGAPLIDPPELLTMREEHFRSMQRAAVPVLSAYVRALETQKMVFTRQGKLDEALAVDKELKDVQRELQIAVDLSARSGAIIVSALYGAPEGAGIDISKNLRRALESGRPIITADAAGGMDPAPNTRKQATIIYVINGQRKQKVFPEGQKLNFKEDLQ